MSYLINLKASEKEKFKDDGEWFKKYMKYIIPFGGHHVPDYEKMSAAYKAVNMDLSSFKKQMDLFCNPLGDLADTIQDEITPYPELKKKISVLKGEAIKRNDQLKLQLQSSLSKRKKNEELINKIRQSVEEKVALTIQSTIEQMKGRSQEEVQQYIESIRKSEEPEDLLSKEWLSDLEVFYNKLITFCYQDQNVKMLQSDTIEDAVITDRFFVYNGWRNGRPYFEIRNPLYIGFHKNPNEPFVHKGDWVWYRKTTTLANAIVDYNLTDEQIEQLSLTSGNSLTNKHDAIGGTAEIQVDHSLDDMYYSFDQSAFNKQEGLNQSSQLSRTIKRALIYETHLEFKAFKKIIFLSYLDEYGKQVVEALSSDYEIPSHATKEKYFNRFDQETERYVWFDTITNTEYSAEEIFIPRAYEVVRLGNNVYPVMREVPYQDINIEDPYSSFELNTKGCVFNARNAESISPIQQALPSYFQYLYIKYIQNKELSKYRGFIQSVDVDQIPDDLAKDQNGNEVRDKVTTYLAFMRKSNIDLFSGSQSSLGGLPPSTRSPGSNGFTLGTAVELMNLQNLAELVSREISNSMGISPQREANYTQGSNVADNQQAVINSYTITEPLFFKHSLVWKDAISTWLKQFRKYCQIQMEIHNLKDLSFEIWLSDGTKELLKITPSHLEHADIGLYLVNSSAAEKYAEIMLQSAHAFAQNQGQGIEAVSQIIKDIVSGASPEEIHKRIKIEEQKAYDRQASLQEQQANAQKELQQMQLEARKGEQEFELNFMREKAELERVKALQVEGIKATVLGKQEDTNDNGIPDSVDLAKLAIEQQKLSLSEKQFEHQKEIDKQELSIKRNKK